MARRPVDADTFRIGGAMATRMQQRQQHRHRRPSDEAGAAAERSTRHDDDLKHDLDDLLDEIDGVLEENAEEFVNAYVQKGGE
jgi:prokaryotic ubiquitin-like protein Pup